MSSKRYMTVVFEITNEESFKQVIAPLVTSMGHEDGAAPGIIVTACGTGDTMTAYDALADTLYGQGFNSDNVVRGWCNENGISEEDTKLIIG